MWRIEPYRGARDKAVKRVNQSRQPARFADIFPDDGLDRQSGKLSVQIVPILEAKRRVDAPLSSSIASSKKHTTGM
jgi:hypothetical protein